jgi:hypothetical protein
MTYSNEIKFQYYKANIKDSKPLGTVNLDQFFSAIQNPRPEIKEVFTKIRQAETDGDMQLKSELKTSLYSFTPAVTIKNKRCYDEINHWTGLMPLDFDKMDATEAVELKEHLFYDFPYIIASWLSASKCGVRALVNIPIVDSIDEFKLYFEGLMQFSDIGKYKNFDQAPKNCVLPLFLSYDPEILYGDTEAVWDRTYKEPQYKAKVQYKYEENPNKVYQIIRAAINKINDNGHPQLRAASYALGGYVAAGYLQYNEAVDLIYNLIDSNAYLSQKSPVYKKTSENMIQSGIKDPLYL